MHPANSIAFFFLAAEIFEMKWKAVMMGGTLIWASKGKAHKEKELFAIFIVFIVSFLSGIVFQFYFALAYVCQNVCVLSLYNTCLQFMRFLEVNFGESEYIFFIHVEAQRNLALLLRHI